MIGTSIGSNFWIEGCSHESGRDSSGKWVQTKIDLEFISIEEDILPTIYQNNFLMFKHLNYFSKDEELGPVVISVRVEHFQDKQLYHVLLRLIGGTLYKCVSSELLHNVYTFEQVALVVEPRLKLTKLHQIFISSAPELINTYDLHNIVNKHKFGILYQRFGQTTEEEILSNRLPSVEFNQFLSLLGDVIILKDFSGFSGGLDTKHNLTGSTSLFTLFQDREIMFHVSSMLPYDENDFQQIQRKRHIGNDIVAILFQDENAVYIPGTFKSHFLKVIFVIQPVKDLNNQTLYKLKLVVDQDCSYFNPLLPHPPVYLKNDDFRTFLLIKMVNAELSAYKSPQFAKLNCRTREQLLKNLIQKLNNSNSKTCDSINDFALHNRPNNTVRRKLNYIFRSKQREQNVSFDSKTSLNGFNRIGCFHSVPIGEVHGYLNSRRHHDNSDQIRSLKLSLSETPKQIPNIQSKPISSKSGHNPLPSSTYKYCDDLIHVSTTSRREDINVRNHTNQNSGIQSNFNNHVSLDENSFSSMILGSLSSTLRLHSNTSLGFCDLIGYDSVNSPNFRHSPLDYERHHFTSIPRTEENFNSFNTKNIPSNLNSTDLVPVNEQYVESCSVLTELKDQLEKVISADKLKAYKIQYLQASICTLLEMNKELMRRLSQQSKEITELNSDLRLFVYYQKHSNLDL